MDDADYCYYSVFALLFTDNGCCLCSLVQKMLNCVRELEEFGMGLVLLLWLGNRLFLSLSSRNHESVTLKKILKMRKLLSDMLDLLFSSVVYRSICS